MIPRLVCLFGRHKFVMRGVLVRNEDWRSGAVRPPCEVVYQCRCCGKIPEPFIGLGDPYFDKPEVQRKMAEIRELDTAYASPPDAV